jgi:hypothetical protein
LGTHEDACVAFSSSGASSFDPLRKLHISYIVGNKYLNIAALAWKIHEELAGADQAIEIM